MLTTHSRPRRRTRGRLAGAVFAAGLTATTLFAASGPAQATPAPAAEAARAAMAYDHTYIAVNLDRCQHVRRQYSSWAWVGPCYPYDNIGGGYWAFGWTCRIC